MTMGPAIVTGTAAGAIDATYRVTGALARGEFTRATAYTREVSGKGVNVAAGLRLAARSATAVVVIGADDADLALEDDLGGRGLLEQLLGDFEVFVDRHRRAVPHVRLEQRVLSGGHPLGGDR